MIFLFYFTSILFLVYSILFLYYRYGWILLKEKKTDETFAFRTTVSVVIPFRNEALHLPKLLNCLSSQQYPKHLLEIILIDDHSEDGGSSLITDLHADHIKCISLSDHLPKKNITAYKKKAIEAAIRISKGELIITTDADCTMGPLWISSIVAEYEKSNAVFLVMPVLMKADQTVSGLFQSLDFMTMQGITAASSALRFHLMSNGANLAYTRTVFDEVDGFVGIDQIASGDDILLMHKIAKIYPDKIVYLKSKDAIVTTSPAPGWQAFLQQRIRWASKAGHYQDKKMLPVLIIVYLFNVSLFFLLLLSIMSFFHFQLWDKNVSFVPLFTLIFFLLKTGVELLLLYPVSAFFENKKELISFPIFQPLHVLYMVIAGWLGKFGTYNWKDRKLK